MKLSHTAYVILGMLRHQRRSGYEIKQAVDGSTRFFWAASYGQIYPELRKLAEAGLVAGEEQPTGGRKRTLYRLTAAGRSELRRWLAEPPEVLELRDEGLLKLFFAAAARPEDAAQILEGRKRLYQAKLARLREIEESASFPDPFPHAVLRYGIESSQWAVEWCERTRRRLAAKEVEPQEKRRARR